MERRRYGSNKEMFVEKSLDPWSIHELGNITNAMVGIIEQKYQAMAERDRACIVAVQDWLSAFSNTSWLEGYNLSTLYYAPDQNSLTPFKGTGQFTLLIKKQESDVMAMIDVAAYLWKVSVDNIPVIIGRQSFIEEQISDFYSQHFGQEVRVTTTILE